MFTRSVAQAITWPGGTLLDYRVGRNGALTLCEEPAAIRRP